MDALELKNTVSEIKISRNRHNCISDTAEEKMILWVTTE